MHWLYIGHISIQIKKATKKEGCQKGNKTSVPSAECCHSEGPPGQSSHAQFIAEEQSVWNLILITLSSPQRSVAGAQS